MSQNDAMRAQFAGGWLTSHRQINAHRGQMLSRSHLRKRVFGHRKAGSLAECFKKRSSREK